MPHVSTYNARRIIMLIMLAFIVIYLITHSQGREKVIALIQSLPKTIRWALGLFFLLGIVSSLTAINSKMAFLEVGNYFLLFIFSVLG